MVHNLNSPTKISFFQRSMGILSKTRYPVKLYGDKDTDMGLIEDLIIPFNTIELREGPNTEWGKFEYAFDQAKADYVACCHCDDYWLVHKLDQQLKYIENVPLVSCSYLHDKYDWPEIYKETPQTHSYFGLVNCMPSTWVINKKMIKTLPFPYHEVACMDLGLALAISQFGHINILMDPLVIYHNHSENGWHTVGNECIERGRKALHDYAQQVPKPILQYKQSDYIHLA